MGAEGAGRSTGRWTSTLRWVLPWRWAATRVQELAGRQGTVWLRGPARRWTAVRRRLRGSSLKARLLFSYVALTLLALGTVDLLALTALTGSTLQERRQTLLGHGRVVAGVSARYMVKGHDYLESIARDYGQQAGVRVLVLDGQGQVLRDSFYDPAVLGTSLRHREEVAAALRGQTATRMETVPGVGRTLYAAVPIQDQGRVVGAVLVAQAVEADLARIAGIGRVLLLVSATALVLATGVGRVLATSLAGPVTALTRAVRAIQSGDLSQRAPVTREDELGRLAAAFNGRTAGPGGGKPAGLHRQRRPRAAYPPGCPQGPDGAPALRRRHNPAEQAEFLRDLGREVDRLADLAGDLLTLSELEAGRPLQKAPTRLDALVAVAAERLQPLAREREVTLHWAVPPDLTLIADGRKLERAVYNLIHNGIQYNRPGGSVAVTVATEAHGVRLTVADEGPGIPPEDLLHIFERFYRAERSRSRGHGGAGLGLAIVREIVESHGGTIQVESRPGEGTCFEVVLPRS